MCFFNSELASSFSGCFAELTDNHWISLWLVIIGSKRWQLENGTAKNGPNKITSVVQNNTAVVKERRTSRGRAMAGTVIDKSSILLRLLLAVSPSSTTSRRTASAHWKLGNELEIPALFNSSAVLTVFAKISCRITLKVYRGMQRGQSLEPPLSYSDGLPLIGFNFFKSNHDRIFHAVAIIMYWFKCF